MQLGYRKLHSQACPPRLLPHKQTIELRACVVAANGRYNTVMIPAFGMRKVGLGLGFRIPDKTRLAIWPAVDALTNNFRVVNQYLDSDTNPDMEIELYIVNAAAQTVWVRHENLLAYGRLESASPIEGSLVELTED